MSIQFNTEYIYIYIQCITQSVEDVMWVYLINRLSNCLGVVIYVGPRQYVKECYDCCSCQLYAHHIYNKLSRKLQLPKYQ